MGNDLAALDALFWESEHTLRYGVGEALHGIDAIREFRRNRIGGSPQRTLHHTLITTFGTDLGTANTQFVRANSPQIGRQSQTWVRMDEGWRIVAAHVSMMACAPVSRRSRAHMNLRRSQARGCPLRYMVLNRVHLMAAEPMFSYRRIGSLRRYDFWGIRR